MTDTDSNGKEISNPFSTGGGGFQFESHVQASFVILMLAGGFVPCLPALPIKKIKLQGKIDGYNTDDLIVFMEKPDGALRQKLMGQIKHSVNFTAGDPTFRDIIHSAWRDFCDSNLFVRRQDAIAVITGPLSAKDIDGARWILEWARSCETAAEFLRNVDTAKFSSDNKRDKLAAFRAQLAKANDDIEVSEEQLFEFLRHFHILSYDLDVKAGIVLSLLHSLMNQYSMESVRAIWSQVVDEVQNANKNAGTLTIESMPLDLRAAFSRQEYATIPATFAPDEPEKVDLNQLPHATTIAIANLVGAWDENSEADTTAISKLVKEDFSCWIAKLQEVVQIENSPISFRDGEWHITQRLKVWQSLGKRIFDNSVEAFKLIAISILSERDPKFELPPDERFGASFQGKTLSYSRAIRKGIAETLALMGADPKAISNCSDGKIRSTAILSLREILKDADWITWGSLNDLLPLLAEAGPVEFLSSVERGLGKDPCPFDELFRQEGNGITGENFLTGLLWSLESLAWDEEHLVQVCVLLSELAARDPGGQSGNRPFNSLKTILLPWLPQTEASVEKRRVAIETVAKEQTNIAWKLLLSLLPKQNQMSMRTHRPIFKLAAASENDEAVSKHEYWQQVSLLADMATNLAGDDIARLTELAAYLDRLPVDKIAAFAEQLEFVKFESKPADATVKLWKKLRNFVAKQQRIREKSTDLSKAVASLEAIVKSIEPKNPAYQYQQLFGHNDAEFYRGDDDNWDEKAKKQEERRQQAIKEILEYGGLAAVREFIELADESIFVGHTLGTLAGDEMDSHILPQELTSENIRMLQFLYGYVRAGFHKKGWEWVEGLAVANWTRLEIGKFFALLPFSSDTWKRVKDFLGESDSEYWNNVNPNPYEATTDLSIAIDKFIEFKRPILALACLNRGIHEKYPFDVRQAERALLTLLASSELKDAVNRHEVMKVINALQQAADADPDVVSKIEWQFLPLIDRDLNGSPKLLERRLAATPEFFSEMISLGYRSKNEPKEERRELTPQEQEIAKNAWTLLYDWEHPPGLNRDGTFSADHFKQWLERTRKICAESGHLSVALIHIGRVLFYGPPDPDGLWIHKAIAEALNEKDAEKLRSGFGEQLFNSRGVHWVDPSGQEERDLAEKYREQAEIIENAGYQRFAASLREVAQSYEREADRVIKEAEAEKFEDDDK